MVALNNKRKEYDGHAMRALADNSIVLDIFCAELFPGGTSGAFSPQTTTSPITTTNDAGVANARQVTTSNHITAEWRSMGTQLYPPKVVKGEQVILYQIGDNPKWYWDTKGRDSELRTTDRQRSYVSATPNANEQKTDDNTYFSEMDSVNQRVTLIKTSKVNGEVVKIFAGADTAAGVFVITDDKGVAESTDLATLQNTNPSNSFVLDFANNVFQFTTNDKSFIQMNKKDIIIYAERDLFLRAKRQIVADSPVITINKTQTGTFVVNANDVTMNVTASFVVNAAVAGINAVTKITGALTAAAVRAVSYVTGAVGGSYTGATTNITAGSTTASSNTADTNTAGSGNRYMAAWDQVDPAFQATADAIKEVAKAAKTSVDTSGITSNSAASKVKVVKGE